MSRPQFRCLRYLNLDLHGLIFEMSVQNWQDQPGFLHQYETALAARTRARTRTRTALASDSHSLERQSDRHPGKHITASRIGPQETPGSSGLGTGPRDRRPHCIACDRHRPHHDLQPDPAGAHNAHPQQPKTTAVPALCLSFLRGNSPWHQVTEQPGLHHTRTQLCAVAPCVTRHPQTESVRSSQLASKGITRAPHAAHRAAPGGRLGQSCKPRTSPTTADPKDPVAGTCRACRTWAHHSRSWTRPL